LRLGEAILDRYKYFDRLNILVYALTSRVAGKSGSTVVYPHGGLWVEVADFWSHVAAAFAALDSTWLP